MNTSVVRCAYRRAFVAIDTYTSPEAINRERLLEIKARHLEVFDGLLRYEAELKAKNKLRYDQETWLRRFEEAKTEGE